MRWIVHVDMDAYFASVEQAVQPSLRGLPVIVGGRPGSRGVVTTASYEARPFGVRAGMPIGEAVRRCPHAVFLTGNYALYTHTSKRIFDVLRRFTPRVEPASIDEAYLELETELEPLVLCARIQSEIDRDIGLGASLGISESKYVAKVASSFAKPRGLTWLPVAEVAARLWPLPVATLYGVGPKTEARLHALGLRTIGAVATADDALLERKLGAWGPALRRHARGESRGRVVPPDEAPDAKSIGNERTLERDERDPDKLEALVATLAEKVGCRARSHALAGRRVVLKLRDPAFHTITHGCRVPYPVDADPDISRVARSLLRDTTFWHGGVRLVGVSLEQLVRVDRVRQLAFDFDARRLPALAGVDALRSKYGETVIVTARAMGAGRSVRKDRISFHAPDLR